MDAFIKLLNDDVDVLKYITSRGSNYCIAEKGSDDIDKALRETLQKLIDVGATDTEIEVYTGLTKRLTDPDNHINVGSGYVFNGLIHDVITIKQDFHRFKIGDWVKVKTLDEMLEVYKESTNICKAIIEKRDFSVSPNSEFFNRRMYSFLGKVYQIVNIDECIAYQKVYLQSVGEPSTDLYYTEPYYFNAKWLNEFSNDFEIIDRDRLEGLI